MASNVSLWPNLKDMMFGGIQPDLPGHGGEECANFLPTRTLVLDTVLSTTMMVTVGIFGALTYTMPKRYPRTDDFLSKRLMLGFLCLLFGVEVGYKLASRQLLYLLNPCHIITIIEIYLLAARPGKLSFSVLRILVHYVYGALVAMVFPDTYCRLLPGEVFFYWLQHSFIFFVVPPYLIYIWGSESLEPFSDWAWPCFSGILFGIHNHYILQPVALLTHVNLNFILCPGKAVPGGAHYRTLAVFHQAACLLTLGKLYTAVIKRVLKLFPEYKPDYKLD